MKRVVIVAVLVLLIVALAGCRSVGTFVFNVVPAEPKSPEEIEQEKRITRRWIIALGITTASTIIFFAWANAEMQRQLDEFYEKEWY